MSTLEKEKSSSSSSSSDDSSKDDIQVDTAGLEKSMSGNEDIARSNSAGDDAQLASGVDIRGGTTTTPNSYSTRLDVGNLDDSSPGGVKQPPPAQMMARSDAPDPYRIPSTVFERTKSTALVEWSVASNESLFSIHVGNSSFSRDQVFLLGRSGELANFSNSPPDVYTPIPPLIDPEAKKADSRIGHKQDVATGEGHVNKGMPPLQGVAHSSSTTRPLDARSNSFAFPILTEGTHSAKVEPEHQPSSHQQTKEENHKEATEVVPDAEQSKWFPCCSCSFRF